MKPLCKQTDRELIIQLVDALHFYANPETYFAIAFLSDPPSGPFMEDFSDTYLNVKPGKLARKVLGSTMCKELNRRWPIPDKK